MGARSSENRSEKQELWTVKWKQHKLKQNAYQITTVATSFNDFC